LLAGHGLAHDSVAAWDRSWRVVLAGLAFVLVLGFVLYRFGLPALARTTADRMPASALDTLSSQIEHVLNRSVFSDTKISGQRQIAIADAFRQLRLPSGTTRRLQLLFKRSDALGANAIALPSGTIFVTDALVEMTDDDRLIMAVLAHEAGHVHQRHGLRQIIQSTIMGALVTWYIGDVSALGAAAPTALLEAKYSRDLEREADAYAADVLRLNGLPVSVLADALDALERSHGGTGKAGALTYLSSHPATAERMEILRK
jgi:Zn-dependent protease with chaperone function